MRNRKLFAAEIAVLASSVVVLVGAGQGAVVPLAITLTARVAGALACLVLVRRAYYHALALDQESP